MALVRGEDSGNRQRVRRRARWLPDRAFLSAALSVVGLVAGLAALWLPTLNRHISPNLRASDLQIALGSGWRFGWLNWGSVTSVFLVCFAAARFVPERLWPGSTFSLAAGMQLLFARLVLALPFMVLIHSRYAAPQLMHDLLYDQASYTLFSSQLPYSIGTSPLTSFFGLNLSTEWSLLLNCVGGAIACMLLAGIALVVGSSPRGIRTKRDRELTGEAEHDSSVAPSQKKPSQKKTWFRRGAVLLLPAAIAFVTIGFPLVGAAFAGSGFGDTQNGDYAQAQTNLNTALSWSPDLVSSDDWVGAQAQLDFARSGPASAAGVFWAAKIYADRGYPQQQLLQLRRAVQLDPGNRVLRDDLVLASTARAFAARDLSAITELPYDLQSRDLVQYTLGRLKYVLGQEAQAVSSLLHVAQTARSGDLRSSAWTYLAFIDDRAGNLLAARSDVQLALRYDPDLSNAQAAAYATGLYVLPR